jgi:uroporphyrinogen decarboxylase
MTSKPFLRLLENSQPPETPPIWLMRQAGRYLPEYRATRETAGGFLDLCYNPALAEEVTLQPIRRYGFDASILFADILLIPQALGQKLWFETGEGPRLTPIMDAPTLDGSDIMATLAPVIETVGRLSKSLPAETTLIGFAGAPWTVATYMVAGRGTPDQAPARELAEQQPEAFQAIIDVLIEATIEYLHAQVSAGAEVVQLFESWAGSLTGAAFERWCIEPVAKIVQGLRGRGVSVPIIGFPRAADHDMADYVARTACQILGLDTFADRKSLAANLPKEVILQGNLDPLTLVEGGAKLDAAIDEILQDFEGRRFVFNLGHGIVPQTPPEHVAQLVNRIRKN